MDRRTRASVIIIRLAALIVMIASVAALWNFMLWLPWQVDCVLAAAAAFAFAYFQGIRQPVEGPPAGPRETRLPIY